MSPWLCQGYNRQRIVWKNLENGGSNLEVCRSLSRPLIDFPLLRQRKIWRWPRRPRSASAATGLSPFVHGARGSKPACVLGGRRSLGFDHALGDAGAGARAIVGRAAGFDAGRPALGDDRFALPLVGDAEQARGRQRSARRDSGLVQQIEGEAVTSEPGKPPQRRRAGAPAERRETNRRAGATRASPKLSQTTPPQGSRGRQSTVSGSCVASPVQTSQGGSNTGEERYIRREDRCDAEDDRQTSRPRKNSGAASRLATAMQCRMPNPIGACGSAIQADHADERRGRSDYADPLGRTRPSAAVRMGKRQRKADEREKSASRWPSTRNASAA